MGKYTISISGYGCELTIGSVSEEEKEILSNEDKELIEIVTEDFDYGPEEIDDDATKDLLACWHGEKGEFFRGYVEAEEFDISKLKIEISEVEIGDDFYFGDIISKISYDGEELDNWGGDTTGKSFDAWKSF